jgi:formate dehydrogenase major subunit
MAPGSSACTGRGSGETWRMIDSPEARLPVESRDFEAAPENALLRLAVTQMTILIDASPINAQAGERLIDVIGRSGVELPHVCYHPQLGPIRTCDMCLVEIDGELVRACATLVSPDMSVRTATPRAQSARTEAFDRILTNHLLYCTVCDNNNGDCTVHNTTRMLGVEHQSIPFKTN